MSNEKLDYLLEWVHLSLTDGNLEAWNTLFDDACVAWNLKAARQLLREAKSAPLVPRDRAYVRHRAGKLAAQLGNLQEAVTHLTESVALLDGEPLDRDIGLLLGDLGMYQRIQGLWQEAVATHQYQLEVAQTLDDLFLMAEAHDHLGLDYWHQDRLTLASEHLEQALTIRKELENAVGWAYTLNKLGLVRWKQQQLDTAQDLFEQARAVFMEADMLHPAAQAIANLGGIFYEKGEWVASEEHIVEALAILQTLDVVYDQVGLLNNLGGLALAREDTDGARDYYQAALDLATTLGDPGQMRDMHHNLGEVARRQMHVIEAQTHFQAALDLNRPLADVQFAHTLHRLLVKTHVLGGTVAASRAFHRETRLWTAVRLMVSHMSSAGWHLLGWVVTGTAFRIKRGFARS